MNRESLSVKRKEKEKESADDTLPDTLHEESGIEGARVVSDTGIYAIMDQDGRYHYPFIETGERLLKIDPSTLPEGAVITTESPRKVTVTEGILTKVSFGVKPKEEGQGAGKKCGMQNAEWKIRSTEWL